MEIDDTTSSVDLKWQVLRWVQVGKGWKMISAHMEYEQLGKCNTRPILSSGQTPT